MVWKCMSWNIRGWGGRQDKTKKKMKKIKSEIEGYDVIILTETHLSKEEEEINKMEKHLQEYNLFHIHDKENASGRKGVTIGIKKNRIEIENIEIKTDQGEEEEGRWIRVTLNKMLDKPLNIWGIYAPTNAKNRKKWLRELGREIRQTNNGYRMIAGDFNFIMNIKLDKRGGRSDRGTAGRKEQK